jgi:hypothetical protein
MDDEKEKARKAWAERSARIRALRTPEQHEAYKEYQRQYRKKNAEKLKLYKRNRRVTWAWHIRANYGLTLNQYDELLIEQSGRCAICCCVTEDLFVDHDHSSGKVRGLLCVNCNFLIGHAGDDSITLELSIAYLKKNRSNSSV